MAKKKVEFPEFITVSGVGEDMMVVTDVNREADDEMFVGVAAEYRLVRKGKLVVKPAALEFEEEVK